MKPASLIWRLWTLAIVLFLHAQALLLERVAAEPESPFSFTDVADERGIADALRGMMGHAAAWGDVNGDGRLDLFVGTFADRPAEDYIAGGARSPVPNRLLIQNEEGKFILSKQEDGFAWLGRASGAVMADLDNDGLPDLYVSNNGRLGKENLLYHNQKPGGSLNKVTAGAGAPLHLPETSRSVTTADFDGDGNLDLLVLGTINRSETMLFRNLGAMKFERSDAIPGDACGLGVAVADITGNGWPDVFIAGCNRFFVNLGKGKFREGKELDFDWGFAEKGKGEGNSPACGAAFGDIDRDGDPDLLLGSHFKTPWNDPQPLRLFRNTGSTTKALRFEEITEKAGILPYPMKVPHVEIRDFDNDGWPDLYTAVVTMREGKVFPAIYKNLGPDKDGVPRFQETAFVQRAGFPAEEDLAPGQRTAVFFEKLVANRKVMYFAPGPSADFDNDGRLDLFLPSWWPKFPSMLLRNDTPAGNYLDVKVVGSDGINRMGIGSVVRAYPPGKAGDKKALLASEAISTGYGFCSAQPPIAHLGLGKVERCDIVITLPQGNGEVVRKNIKVNQTLIIQTESENPESAAYPSGVRAVRIQSSADGSQQPSLFYHPPVEKENASIPLLVALHTWSSDWKHPYNVPLANGCIERGWAFLHPNFRGPNKNPDACGSKFAVTDIKDAVAWALKNHPVIDPDRVYLAGASGGGHMSLLMAGRAPQLWAGISSWVPITDCVAWHAECIIAKRKYAADLVASCGGKPGDSAEVDAQYRQRSPLTWLEHANGKFPISINAGIRDGHDGSVPISHSLHAFNVLATPADRISSKQIDHFTKTAQVPDSLVQPMPRIDSFGKKKPLFQVSSNSTTLTIFAGGHEMIPAAIFDFLEGKRRDQEIGK